MRCKLITYAMEQGLDVIGQARKDTALFHTPERTGKRGRPRKYGERVTAGWIASLPEVRQQFTVYGKTQKVHYRSAIVLARFLKGKAVRVVWSQLEKEDGTRTQQCLLLSTDITLSGARIILGYGRRWSIEDLFNQPKNRWDGKKPGSRHDRFSIVGSRYFPSVMPFRSCSYCSMMQRLRIWLRLPRGV